MRWFGSFAITTLIAGVTAGLLWLRDHPPFGIVEISDALRWVIPDVIATFVTTFTLPLLFATLALVRLAAQRVLAYTESATDAAPRAQPGKRAALGAAANVLFHNPSRWWLAPYTVIVGVVVAISGVVVIFFDRDPATRLAWGLTAAFGATLVGAMAMPDKVQPLRAVSDPDPDPVLALPGDDVAPTEPAVTQPAA